jgi:membrane-associated phospholipid phosphatase
MDLVSIVAAGGSGSGDLVVGLLVGCCVGFLVGPAFRSWQSYREWSEASREVRLADRLLERMRSRRTDRSRERP